jgi:hypothetical protein
MRQLNDRPKSQTAKTSSEQVPYRSLVCKHKSSFAALLLLFPKSLRLFGNPYTSERLMYCGALAQVLDVSPQALDVPDIDSYIGLMHTLFTLEDIYGLTVSEADGEVCLKVNKDKGREAYELLKMLYAWKEQADKLSSEEINREEYDNWRYHYPEFDTTQRWAKVPSQELSDALVEAFKDHLKDK